MYPTFFVAYMSLLQNSNSKNNAYEAPTAAGEHTNSDGHPKSMQTAATPKTHSARVLVTANAKGRDLMNEGVVQVASLGSDPELKNAIIKKVSTTAWNNPLGATVLVSAQLAGDNAAPISASARNELGWLEHNSESFGARPSDKFSPLLAMMPWETSRAETVLYSPQQIANEDLVERYGSVKAETLHEGIIPFPGQDYYYLDKDHVVADVISRNWDQLGLDPSSERTREGKWLKVQRSVVDVCLEQLKSNVLTKLPKTDLQNGLSVHFAADKSCGEELHADANYPISCELTVEYTVPGSGTAEAQ